MMLKAAFIVFLFSWFLPSESSDILFLTPLGTKSHKHVFEPLIRELGQRGHNVTVLANVKSKDMGPNVTEHVLINIQDFLTQFPNPFEDRKHGILNSFWDLDFMFRAADSIFQKEEFHQIMNRPYDLVIVNGLLNDIFEGYLPKIGAPYIHITSMAATNAVTSRFGNWLPPSFVPHSFFPFRERMSFMERLLNTVVDTIFWAYRHPRVSRRYEAVYRKYLGEDTPGIAEIHGNTSLLLMNSHINFPSPRPTLPDVVQVGGMHCRPAEPLPKDIEDFVAGAKDGFIFFSMGSVVQSKNMPHTTRQVFINVFSKLKQRVLWKWDEDIPGVASNTMIRKWLPQQDILGHPNIRLFITHGGLLSTQESIYHGVPLLGIPMFIDQDLNMNQAEAAGFGVTVEILDITEEKLSAAISKPLNDPKILEQAKFQSSTFKDQLQTPVERAVFWVEYIIRHKGAPQLRSAARDLNIFQYYCLDVIAVLGGILLVVVAIVYLLLRTVLKLLNKLIVSNANVADKKLN